MLVTMSDEKRWNANQAVSWAVYDLANTIYSAAVVTVFLPLYITAITRVNMIMGVTATVAMIIAGIFSPPLGAMADRTGHTKRYLIISTLICCAAVFLFVLPIHYFWILGFFVVAHFFYHLSLVYYNSLLPVVAPPERQGWVSGLGTGLGYAGVLLALPVGYWVEKEFGTRFVFPAVAIVFILGTLPLLLFVPERAVASPQKFSLKIAGEYFSEVLRTIISLPAHPRVLNFLLASFFVQEAVNAAILWLSVFIKFTFGLDQGAVILVVLTSNLTACVFGFVMGWITDRYGAYKSVFASVIAFFGALSFLAFAQNAYLALGALLTLGSLGLAGTWVAGRKLLIEMSPPEKIGEFFGLYSMSSKFACFSMAIFAWLADKFSFRAAIIELLVMMMLGMFFLSKVRSSGFSR